MKHHIPRSCVKCWRLSIVSVLENHRFFWSPQVTGGRQRWDFDLSTMMAGCSGRNGSEKCVALARNGSRAGWDQSAWMWQLLFVKEIWCFIREKLCTETWQRFLNGILIKGANNLNARLVAFGGRMHDGECMSIFFFPSALLGSIHLSLCGNEKRAGWWSREVTGKQSVRLAAPRESKGTGWRIWLPESWNKSLGCPLDHLRMQNCADVCWTFHQEPSGMVEDGPSRALEWWSCRAHEWLVTSLLLWP